MASRPITAHSVAALRRRTDTEEHQTVPRETNRPSSGGSDGSLLRLADVYGQYQLGVQTLYSHYARVKLKHSDCCRDCHEITKSSFCLGLIQTSDARNAVEAKPPVEFLPPVDGIKTHGTCERTRNAFEKKTFRARLLEIRVVALEARRSEFASARPQHSHDLTNSPFGISTGPRRDRCQRATCLGISRCEVRENAEIDLQAEVALERVPGIEQVTTQSLDVAVAAGCEDAGRPPPAQRRDPAPGERRLAARRLHRCQRVRRTAATSPTAKPTNSMSARLSAVWKNTPAPSPTTFECRSGVSRTKCSR